TVAVMVAASVLHGIRYDSVSSLIGAALLLGILNAFVRPVLLILSAPLILLTLGFFILVVNGLLLWFVPNIVPGFHVDNFGSAFWGAIVIGLVSWMLSAFFRGSDGRVHVLTHHTQSSACKVALSNREIAHDLLPGHALSHRRGFPVRFAHQRRHG